MFFTGCQLSHSVSQSYFIDFSGEKIPASIETISISTGQSRKLFRKENCRVLQLSSSNLTQGNLILVNAQAPYDFSSAPAMISLLSQKGAGYKVKDETVLIDPQILTDLNAMMKDFSESTGYRDVTVVSGYRTWEYQQTLLEREIAQSGEAEARRWVALPGCSEHHTGLALDFSIYHDNGISEDYTGEGVCRWIAENSWKYGFVLRYPKEKESLTGISYEPWHFRWVGLPHAIAMTKNGLCLEEYINFLKTFTFESSHLLITYGNTEYEIWYEAGNTIHVPENAEYTFSGTNTGGVVVTSQRPLEE